MQLRKGQRESAGPTCLTQVEKPAPSNQHLPYSYLEPEDLPSSLPYPIKTTVNFLKIRI